MFTITEHQVEAIRDPFGILKGSRYEFLLNIEVSEEDELFSENGLYVRAIYNVEDDKSGLVKYELYERGVDKYLDFELEEDEIAAVVSYCQAHLPGAEA